MSQLPIEERVSTIEKKFEDSNIINCHVIITQVKSSISMMKFLITSILALQVLLIAILISFLPVLQPIIY
jgi:hypothetical protein